MKSRYTATRQAFLLLLLSRLKSKIVWKVRTSIEHTHYEGTRRENVLVEYAQVEM